MNVAVWSVCVDEKCTTTFGVCDDCFEDNKVCWTAFVRMIFCECERGAVGVSGDDYQPLCEDCRESEDPENGF